jgi:hypothetical protein
LLPWKSNIHYVFWLCVCKLSYPACKAHKTYYITICGLSGCTIIFHIISQAAQFSIKVTEYNICVLVFSTTLVRNIYHSVTNTAVFYQRRTFVYVKCSFFLSDVNETWIFSTYLRKILKHQFPLTSFQRRPSSSVWKDVRTDRMTKPIIAFHTFANGPNTMEYNTWALIVSTILLGFMLLVISLFLDALDLVKLGKHKNYGILFFIFSVFQ